MTATDGSGAPSRVIDLARGARLERGDRWNALVLERERPVLSSAPVGGGETRARRVVNLCVDGPDVRALCDDPAAAFAALAARHGWDDGLVGLMTGVSPARLGVAVSTDESPAWTVLATAGTSNAHRAGLPAPAAAGAGTINVIAVTAQGLTAGARAEALALVAEAKAAVLGDLGVPCTLGGGTATGTGTDAVAIIGGDGGDVAYTGYHTDSGFRLVAAVQAAIRDSLGGGSVVG